MRAFLAVAGLLAYLCLNFAVNAAAQSSPALPGCDAPPQLVSIMDSKLNSNLLDKMNDSQRVESQREVIEDLLVHYPHEIRPVVAYINLLKESNPPIFAALRDRWQQLAKDYPDDPMALTTAALALIDTDTPQAIQLLQAAQNNSQLSRFPWPALYLASIYSTGNLADPEKMKQHLEAFYAACPVSTDTTALRLLNDDQPLQLKVAEALRARLEKETDPWKFSSYEKLWQLELHSHPAEQQAAVRAQIARDLKRLTSERPLGDAEWERMLVAGYRQCGASLAKLTAMEDRLLHDYPHSEQAYAILRERSINFRQSTQTAQATQPNPLVVAPSTSAK